MGSDRAAIRSLLARLPVRYGRWVRPILGAAGILGFAAIFGYNVYDLYQDTLSRRASEQLKILTRETQRIFWNDPNRYGGGLDITSTIIAHGGIPSNMVSGAGLVGVWGGRINIVGGPGQFQIYYRSVPTRACIAMSREPPSMSGTFLGNGVKIIFPASAGAAEGACGSFGNRNDVVWASQ